MVRSQHWLACSISGWSSEKEKWRQFYNVLEEGQYVSLSDSFVLHAAHLYTREIDGLSGSGGSPIWSPHTPSRVLNFCIYLLAVVHTGPSTVVCSLLETLIPVFALITLGSVTFEDLVDDFLSFFVAGNITPPPDSLLRLSCQFNFVLFHF